MSDEGGRPPKTFSEWLTALLGLFVSAATVLAVFVKITPIELDTTAEYVIAGLFVVFATFAGAAAWSALHGKGNKRRTALFATLATVALVGGVALVIGTAGAPATSPSATGSPTIATPAPTTTSPTTGQTTAGPDGNGPDANGDDPPYRPTDGHDIPPTGTGTAPNPAQPNDPAPSTDDIRYQGEFRLSASQESVDLDLDPPQPYGPDNELSVEDHMILTVPPYTTGVTVSGSPTRTQCADAVAHANPPTETFDNPQPGDVYCVRTSGDRYALVRVLSAATKDFTLALTVWN